MSPLPKASGEEVVWYQNCEGITMESIEISGTEQQEKSRISPDVRTFQRARALQRFNIKIERNLIFGVYTFTPRASWTSPPAVRMAQRIVPSKKAIPLSSMPSPRN